MGGGNRERNAGYAGTLSIPQGLVHERCAPTSLPIFKECGVMEKAIEVENSNEVYHKSCFAKVFPNDEKTPEHYEFDPQDDDECDYCAAPLLEAPDDDDDDFEEEGT